MVSKTYIQEQIILVMKNLLQDNSENLWVNNYTGCTSYYPW
jgi:hypothetical protein